MNRADGTVADMGLAGKMWFRVVVDLLHDITAAAWPGAVFALWMVRGGAKTALAPDAFSVLMHTWSWVLPVLFLAVVLQVITGSVRLNYWRTTVRPDHLKSKARAAQIKHVVFVALFLWATIAVFFILQP